MLMKNRKLTFVSLAIVMAGLLALTIAVAARPALASVLPQSAYTQLQAAWQRAGERGTYRFASTILQTSYPAANLSNAGRGAKTDRVTVDGHLERASESMQMQMQIGQQPAISMKVEEDVAYARMGADAEWTPLEQTPDLFGPGGDPLGFLAAAEHVRTLSAGEHGMESHILPTDLLPAPDPKTVTRYAFELSGAKFAAFMLEQTTAEMRSRGQLPPLLSLSPDPQYLNMRGQGEIWIDSAGLPLRLNLHVELPPTNRALEWASADITTSFGEWEAAPDVTWTQLWQEPGQWLTLLTARLGITPPQAQQMAFALGMFLLALGLVAFLLTYRRHTLVRATVYLSIILSMLITPLLQTQQVSAFYDGQQARAQEAASTTTPTAESAAPAFNPHENPLRVAMANTAAPAESVQPAAAAAPSNAPAAANLAQAAPVCTVTENSECDADGLSDQVEIHQLGTFINVVDTDNDHISDNLEIQPMTVGGQTWYLDPRSSDSNGDGLADTIECSVRRNVDDADAIDASVTGGACADTDGDGVPDVYDFDNDGDGVPDSEDSAPFDSMNVTDGQFALALSGYQSGHPLLVDLMIRPTDDRHLWWANSVLDWPTNDTQGQVQRVTDETINDQGDMLLVPVVEITIPYNAANRTRGLPVQTGVNVGSIDATTPITAWLDIDLLSDYGILVNGPDAADGALYVSVPVAEVQDEVGGAPVAFGARMPYIMNAAASGWGADHAVRLLWHVVMLNDTCQADETLSADAATAYCNDYANWTSQRTIVESYYDDFLVAGLTVSEEYGAAAAVFGQPSHTNAYEADLWHLAEVLQDTFLTAQKVGSTRLGVGDIDGHLAQWGVSSVTTTEFLGLSDRVALSKALNGDGMKNILNGLRPSAPANQTANLLLVTEHSGRSLSLGATTVHVGANAVTVDLSGAVEKTMGALRMTQYRNTTTGSCTGWCDESLTSFLGDLESALHATISADDLIAANLATASNDATGIVTGAVELSMNYYLALTSVVGNILSIDGVDVGSAALDDSAHQKSSDKAPLIGLVSRLVGNLQQYYTLLSLANISIATSDPTLTPVGNSTWAALGESPGVVLETLGLAEGDVGGSSKGAALAEMAHYVDLFDEALGEFAETSSLAMLMEFEKGENSALKWTNRAAVGGKALYKVWFRFIFSVDKVAVAEGSDAAVEALKAVQEVGHRIVLAGYIAEVAVIAFTTVMTILDNDIPVDSPAFTQVIVDAIAEVIVLTIRLALILNPATAPFIFALVFFDAILHIVCDIAFADTPESNKGAGFVKRWICPGIAGWIARGVAFAINDNTLLMDLERDNQFDTVFETPAVAVVDKASGFAVGNTLTLSATITANAYTGHPNWMGYIWNWQLRDENVKETAVDFRLQTSKSDFDGGLHFGDTAWQRPEQYRIVTDSAGTPTNPQPGKRFETDFQRSVDYTLSKAGVNEGLSGVYLSEAVRVKKQDCWLAPVAFYLVPFCGTDEVFDDTFHQSLEETFIFDIFPATLSDFHALVAEETGQPGMRLAWDDAFPVLRDADGDGLVSKAFNGPDPDDSNPDTDGDGLSDFYEYQNGFNASEADADCDGLTDYWEAFYSTDPNNSDTDHDGLTDGREVFHPNLRYPYENSVFTNANAPSCASENGLTGGYAGGWSTVYAFNGDAPLHFWVSSDPNDADSDDDGLTDRSEQVYGYNPHAPSELDVLSLETEISTSRGLDAYVGLNDSIDYAATITNDLSDRYLRGLLESELPVDTVIKTQEIDLLTPLAATTLAGTIAVADAGITASTATSMTLRAGVNVDDAVDNGQSIWLHLNEAPGATTFVDASLNGKDVSCTTCPTATGSALRFINQNQSLTLDPAIFDLNAFSVGMWVKQVSDGGHFMPFIVQTQQGSIVAHMSWFSGTGSNTTTLNANVGSIIETSFNNWPGTWKHLMLTYDRATRAIKFYLNGVNVGSRSDATQIDTNTANLRFSIGAILETQDNAFEMDEFEFYPHVLDAQTILDRYGKAPLQFALTGAGNGVSCDGDRCPTMNNDGATFDQTKHLALDTSSLSFSNNQFSIAVDVNPQPRPHPFNAEAGTHFGVDTTQDWQGVYGYRDPGNDKLIFPSLYVGSNGALRVDMGDGANTCSYQTANGLVDFGIEQQVAVSYDGSTFTIYINGEERVNGAPTACGGVQIPNINQLYAGRPNNAGYFYWDQAEYRYLDDAGGTAEICLTFDLNFTDDALYRSNEDNIFAESHKRTVQIDVAKRITDDAIHWFRFHEDDTDNCNYNTGSGGIDDELVYRSGLSNATTLGSFQNNFNSCYNCDKGTLYWSLSNEFFAGTLRNLSIFDYALSPTGAERLYNTETFALQLDLDEAPGETTMTDSSGNYFEAGCAGASCPDSGIPGRDNQALRFDGGVADDDGNDGVADYLTMPATDAALGFENGSFTIMAWVKPDAINGNRRILAAERTKSVNGVSFGVNGGNLILTNWGVKVYQSTQSAIPTGQWSHVAVSFDTNNDAHFYVNGQFVETVTGPAPPLVNTDDAYRIGATTRQSEATTAEPWDGLLDDLRILRFAANAGAVQAIMNEAPLLNLHLDEDIDTTSFVNDAPATADASCNAAGATCPGAGDKGAMRESASFDGVDDRIEVADSDALDLDAFTIALWVKPTQKRSDYQAILTKESSKDDRNYGLFIHPDNLRLTYGMASNCANGVGQNSAGSLLQNQWNHVVMTYDGAQARLYINGSVDSSVLAVTNPCHNNQPLQIGDGIQRYSGFAGNLDEITIEQGAVSAEQVAALYLYQSAWYDKKQQHTILVDADAPTASVALGAAFIEPGQVLYIDAEDPTVNGVASGLASVQYSIDGGAFVDAAIDTNAYLIPASATQGLSEGNHTVQVRAADNVGLSSSSQVSAAAVQTVQVDTTVPKPGPGANMPDKLIQPLRGGFALYGRATDDGGAVQSGIDTSSVQATLRDHNGNLVSGPQAVTFTTGPQWQSTHDLGLGAYGEYAFEATARDIAGNEGTASDTIWVDGLPGYGDMHIATNIITGTNAVIGGLASDIPYPESGRKLHFHFEEAAGATLFYDGSVNHLNAACGSTGSPTGNCPTAGATGANDGALTFDGNDYLTISDQDGVSAAQVLGLHGNFTLMAWVKPNGLSGSQQLIAAEQSNSTGGIAFGLNGDKLRVQAFGAGEYLSTTGIAAGAWSHVAAAYNATDNSVTFYVNGELLETVAGSVAPIINSDDAYRIGEGFSGAMDELAVYGGNLSAEEIYDVVHPVSANTSQIKVRYRHASGVVWPHLDADGLALYLPMDEPLGSDSFEDLSIYGRDATCGSTDSSSDTCPLAAQNDGTQAVETGSHLEFDGADDFLTLPTVLDPAATDFTAALWFNVSPLSSGDRYLLQQTDSGGVGRTWLFVSGSGAVRSFLGGSTLEHPTKITPNTWHHAALTYHLATQTLTLYLDGVPVSTTRALEASAGNMLIGVTKSNSSYFRGNIDEVALFDRALTATEISHLGQSPWHDASPVYDSIDNGDTLGVDDRLRPWSHDVPGGLEGPYKIDLLVADGPVPAQREGVSHGVWTGEIDTTAPRVAMTYTLSADKSSVTIACAAADYNLSEEGWECPVDVANRSHHYKDATWFTTIFSDTQKLAGFTTANELFTPSADLHVTACDQWGQCSTLAPQDTDGDGIPDHIEGDGDRDGDGILDAHDYDPDGHFYELGTGRIIPGGQVSVSGPGPVQIDPDGSTGYYDWTTEGVPGLYVMTVTPPAGYIVSPACPPQEGAITPSGVEPQILGSSEVSETETLADGSCAGNPYYLQFNVMNGEPFVFNNNIPLTRIGGALSNRLFMPLVAREGALTGETGQEEETPTLPTLEHPLFLPLIAQEAQIAAQVKPATGGAQLDGNATPLDAAGDGVSADAEVVDEEAAVGDAADEAAPDAVVDMGAGAVNQANGILLPIIMRK
ncbi:MAG: LamG-like jellyroll fold domain-containing protein [Caldilineaceae bacterium]